MIDYKLMKHQKDAVFKSDLQPDLFLAWDMGTGKSCATINMIRNRCQDAGRLRRTLIIGPRIVLHNWKREFDMFSKIPQKAIHVLDGTIKKRVEKVHALKEYPAIFITNYESFQKKEFCDAIKQWGPEILVVDEAHYVKSYKSKRAKNIAEIADICDHRYLLTGTPILNNAMDLFMQYRILDGYLGGRSTFGHNFFVFRSRYFVDANAAWNSKPGHFPNFVPRQGAYKEMMATIARKTLRAEKKDCFELPPLVTQFFEVPMSPEQERVYKEMKKYFVSYLESGEAVTAKLAVTKALRLQQIASGFMKTDEGEVKRFKKVPRLDALKEQLETITPGHKVIVWACFKENYEMIREVCEDIGVKCLELHGATKDKQAVVDEFNNDEEVRVLIGNPGAGGIGVNLVSSTYSIYYSRNFKLGDFLQSQARNYRKGSEQHDKITHQILVAPNTIDALINDALKQKLDISDQILSVINQKGDMYGLK